MTDYMHGIGIVVNTSQPSTSGIDGLDRTLWYNPTLDPRYRHKMSATHAAANDDGRYLDVDTTGMDADTAAKVAAQAGGPLMPPDNETPGNLVSSLLTNGNHAPAWDIDHAVDFTDPTRPRLVTHADRYTGGPCEHPPGSHPVFSALYTAANARLWVPSPTAGHWHLYLDMQFREWSVYRDVMTALAAEGVLERAYVRHSIGRGQSLLRVPGYPKLTAGDAA